MPCVRERCHGEWAIRPIATIPALSSAPSPSVVSKPPGKTPGWLSDHPWEWIPCAQFLECRRNRSAVFWHSISPIWFFWAGVNEESSTGLMPACFRGHNHNTNFCHLLWPWTRSVGHFQAPFSSPGTHWVGISVGPLWAGGGRILLQHVSCLGLESECAELSSDSLL